MAELQKPATTSATKTPGLWPVLRARLPEVRLRPQFVIPCVAASALLFPIVNGNDADIDAAANALAFAALALGLNIVVGFAGLLDLGYAAFFAIGAYAYGVASSWQLQPEWSGFWEPFRWLDLVARYHQAGSDVVHFQVSFWVMLPVAANVSMSVPAPPSIEVSVP